MMLPAHLAHHGKGRAHHGNARRANGLLLRGVVLATHVPGADDKEAGVSCDVWIIDSRYRAKLQRVPVLMRSAGLNDHEVWKPRPATTALAGGQLNIADRTTAPTAAEDMDGDHVLVGFMADDLAQPVILGQLPHPRTKRRPTADDSEPALYRAHFRGHKLSVGEDGSLTLDMTQASDGTIASDGTEQANKPDATLVIKVGAQQKVRIEQEGVTAEGVVKGKTFLTDLAAFLTDLQTFLNALSTFAGTVSGDTVATTTASAAGTLSPSIGTLNSQVGEFLSKVQAAANADSATGGETYASERLKTS